MSTPQIKQAQDIVLKQEDRFKKLAPDMNFNKEAMFAMQALGKNDYLAKCDPKSVGSAILNVSMSGLSLNPLLAHGYLVPRKGKAVFQPGYQGLIYLLVMSGITKSVESRVVYENDIFEREYGTEPKFIHKPASSNKGKVIGFYAIATDNDGNKYPEYMDIDEVRAIAMRSDMNKGAGQLTGAWASDFTEMGRKTVIRRMFKYLPKHNIVNQEAFDRLGNALAAEDAANEITMNKKSETFDISYEDISEAVEVTPTIVVEPTVTVKHKQTPTKQSAPEV